MTKKPKQSLEDWIKEGMESAATAPTMVARKSVSVAPKVDGFAPKATTRYITLDEWAASQFSRVPHYNTLIKWVHDGRIQPQPKKIGRAWQVRPHAEYVCD